jgi:protein-serine/threonine kinase
MKFHLFIGTLNSKVNLIFLYSFLKLGLTNSHSLVDILLTKDLRLPLSSSPLVKLTDFGLSRFVDPKNPLLATRCGSESYAAPEIITGRKYDGSETDAWACGVVLYALATRRLPFESGPTSSSRKAMLMKIAKCEYEWPKDETTGFGQDEGIKRIVGRLLVRDPRKRSKIKYLWDDEWMLGEGAPVPPPPSTPPSPPLDDAEEEWMVEDVIEEDVIDDGLIVDGDQILSVASEELQ